MLADLFILIVNWFLKALIFILPTWQVWPQAVIDGLTYFFNSLMSLNFLFPVDTLLTVIIFVVQFQAVYLTAKIISKIINFFRGTGEGIKI